jgi:Protein of unknown function (DUF1614)
VDATFADRLKADLLGGGPLSILKPSIELQWCSERRICADLLHLKDIQSSSVAMASIGEAGIFDGIVPSGVIAAYFGPTLVAIGLPTNKCPRSRLSTQA